jgi:exopolysaccharide biosynthesis predicted pyruvyltransferase EpsI
VLTRDDTITALAREIDGALGPLIPSGSRCAHLDFPNHANVGDSAIWLGERVYLRKMGASVIYACDRATYSRRRCAARLRDGIILLHGGGNLGDLWPLHQRFREAVIAGFPDNRIIQLPQTIYFRDPANLARARAIFNRHPDLTLLVRDRRSLELARSEFRARSVLCPDMAFALGPLPRPAPPDTEILWLSRTDIESSGSRAEPTGPSVARTDWVRDTRTVLGWSNRLLTRHITRHPRALGWLAPVAARGFDVLAAQRLSRGVRLLSRGRVVITDRLHGHILGTLLGIPHVLLDNSYGKLGAFYETWTHRCGLVRWSTSSTEALDLAASLASSRPPTVHDERFGQLDDA